MRDAKTMDENERLRATVKWRRRPNRRETVSLGDTIGELVRNQISPRLARIGRVVEIWDQLLPGELVRHCRITGLSGGQLSVQADSPVYMHELRLCSPSLLRELRQQCPRARIKTIKVTIG